MDRTARNAGIALGMIVVMLSMTGVALIVPLAVIGGCGVVDDGPWSPRPDLAPGGYGVSHSSITGIDSISVSVTNLGTAPTTAPFTVQAEIYLDSSRTSEVVGSPFFFEVPSGLGYGSLYSCDVYDAGTGASGVIFELTVSVDTAGAVDEYDEGNNMVECSVQIP